MRVFGKHFEAIWWDAREGVVRWIDQTRLPFSFELKAARDPEAVACAIETMQVRGAPTIGAAAAYGLALAWKFDRKGFDRWCQRFARTRPTAVNLFHAIEAMRRAARKASREDELIDAACAYAASEIEAHRKIGELAAELLAKGKRRILTHCNAGWLAAIDWGTALAGIYQLHRAGEHPFVWIDETRPRLQGARLTAWELAQEGVRHCVQVDGAAAYRLWQGEVDAVIVGADRIANNGDVANKIGTAAVACAAKAFGVPFYVAAPTSTIDRSIETGQKIPIEHRSEEEVITIETMQKQRWQRVAIMPSVAADNPAFDITPASFVDAIITEAGIWRPFSESR